MTHHKIDGRTKRALDIAIAKRQVSQDSYRAVLAGEITLQRAKELGRDRGPADTAQGSGDQDEARTGPRSATGDTSTSGAYCLCGCGETTRGGRFKPGHDARLHSELKRNLDKDPLLRNERFTDEQRRYAVERGLVGPVVLSEEERDG
jgi:hypothetical protein